MFKHTKRILIIAMALVLIFSAFAFADSGRTESCTIGDWTYTYAGKTINAKNNVNGETASVTIDTSPVYEMARNYDGGDVEYSVVREDHWHEKEGIAEYYILYSGYEVHVDGRDFTTDKYTDVYHKPTYNGNYSVRIALFEDDDPDGGKELLSTVNAPFYLAMISNYTVTTYGPNEIEKFTRPEFKIGFYHVYTKEELLWVFYNGNGGSFVLENDIVLNPIVIRDGGYISSSQPLIYTIPGLEFDSMYGYTGDFDGNGYTIYGLYCNKQDGVYENAGLFTILDPRYGSVKNVVLDNYYVVGKRAGGLVGMVKDSYKTWSFDSPRISNCKVLNGYVSSNEGADGYGCGGIVGAAVSDYSDAKGRKGYYGFEINNCMSFATVDGNQSHAGGIVGYAATGEFNMYYCDNAGNVNGKDAGGLVGKLYLQKDGWCMGGMINSCENIGNINGSSCSGGLIGCYNNWQWKKEHTELVLTNATNVGLVSKGLLTGGLVGGIGKGRIDIWNCWYFGANQAYQLIGGSDCIGERPDHDALIGKASYTSKKAACKSSSAYCIVSPVWTVQKAPGCESEGLMVQKCVNCGRVWNTQSIPATGHYYEDGETCSYCGQEIPEDDELEGSIFSETSGIVFITATVAVVVIAATLIVHQKKKMSE